MKKATTCPDCETPDLYRHSVDECFSNLVAQRDKAISQRNEMQKRFEEASAEAQRYNPGYMEMERRARLGGRCGPVVFGLRADAAPAGGDGDT